MADSFSKNDAEIDFVEDLIIFYSTFISVFSFQNHLLFAHMSFFLIMFYTL